ncbi:40S ribosomal protein S5 [Gossypium hirsutum]|uniref:40S ribosomal protein S5 n=1 Tax=Gossypium hirsutum TaxID=3635 RepID=A0ABM3ASN2_GOSHI|nr:40S ribosomal protein S5-like [Gossypium hirsutum]
MIGGLSAKCGVLVRVARLVCCTNARKLLGVWADMQGSSRAWREQLWLLGGAIAGGFWMLGLIVEWVNEGLVEAKVPCNLLLECFTCGVVYNLSYVLHTAGRYLVKRFRKAQCPIVERLTNSLMMHGRNNGKKLMAVRIVKHAMEIIYLLTDQNPIQVIVDAIINSGPREDATRIGSAGVVRRQAVDISPLRRVNQAIYLLTTGNRESAFRNIKTIAECLADELINAAKGSSNSYAIKKKDEIERVAKANR